MKTTSELFYHFTGATLRDGRPIPPAGEWLKHDGKLIACCCGLHASKHPADALQYATGNLLHLVKLGEKIVPSGDPVDKFVSTARQIIQSINAEDILMKFARFCAADVLPLWPDAPEIIGRFLENGDESIRADALEVVSAVERDTVINSTRTAARSDAKDAAWAVVYHRDAFLAARGAKESAARAKAWDIIKPDGYDDPDDDRFVFSRDNQRQIYARVFKEMVDNEFKKQIYDKNQP